jgi:hypothetical protein
MRGSCSTREAHRRSSLLRTFLYILYGYPVSFSFFTILNWWSSSSMTPVADMRKDASFVVEFAYARMPVP